VDTMRDDGEPLLSSTLLLTLAEDMLWHVVAVLDADLFTPTRLVCRRLKQIVDEVAERTQVVDVLAESLEDIVCFDSLNLFYPSAPLSSRFLDLLPTCGMQRFNHLMHSLAQLVPRFGDVLDVATFKPDSCLRGRGLCRLRSRRGSDQRRWPRAVLFHWSCFAARGCPASMCRAALTAVLVGSMSVAAGHTLLRAPQRASLAVLRMSASDADLSKLTVVQLKERLRAAGLPLSGRKAELIARLSETASAPAAALVQAAPVPAANLLSGLLETGATAVLPLIEIEACKS